MYGHSVCRNKSVPLSIPDSSTGNQISSTASAPIHLHDINNEYFSNKSQIIENDTLNDDLTDGSQKIGEAQVVDSSLSNQESTISTSLPSVGFSSMHLTIPRSIPEDSRDPIYLLRDSEIGRYRNIYAAQILTSDVFRVILSWGFKKPKSPETSYLQYIQNNFECTNKKLKQKYRLTLRDLALLKKSFDNRNFDVILLYNVIQVCCRNLADIGSDVWKENDDSKVEYLLKKAKDLRNDVCHGIGSTDTSPDTFDDIVNTLDKLLMISGKMYERHQKEIDDEKEMLANKIAAMDQTSNEGKTSDVQKIFLEIYWRECQAYWESHCKTDSIPFSGELINREMVIHPMNISIKTLSASTMKHRSESIISYTQIFDNWPSQETFPITIVRGESGSGKSTLVKNIAMQFLYLVERQVKYLDDFDLIYFLECRDMTSESLDAFINNNFPETCRKIGAADAVDCFSRMKNLILIDGYDERNEKSTQVMNEILQKSQATNNCRFLITTRPHALPSLQHALKIKGFSYRVCELIEISPESEQIKFLLKYEKKNKLNKDNADGMTDAFRNLTDEMKKTFAYPICLVFFYHLFLSSPDEIRLLKSPIDLSKLILRQYKEVIRHKLTRSNVQHCDKVIHLVFEIINDYAFKCVANDKITLTQEDYDEIFDSCSSVLAKYKLADRVDISSILTTVFLTRTSPIIPPCGSIYKLQFYHKSVQEMMAAQSLLRDINENKTTDVKTILKRKLDLVQTFVNTNYDSQDLQNVCTFKKNSIGVVSRTNGIDHMEMNVQELGNDRSDETKSMKNEIIREKDARRLFNVLQMTLMEICRYKSDTNTRTMRQLCSVLQEIGVSEFSEWADIIQSCAQSGEVTQMAAAIIRETCMWEVCAARFISIGATMLSHAQPSLLRVQMPKHEPLPSSIKCLMKAIQQHHSGELRLLLRFSHATFTSCDDLLALLRGARCNLRWFRGCITSTEAVEDLITLGKSEEGPYLIVSLRQPLEHPLMKLQGTQHNLYISARHQTMGPEGFPARPLPIGTTPPEFSVRNSPVGCSHEVESLIAALAPSDKKYGSLQLRNCSLSDISIDKMVKNLQRNQVCETCESDETDWSVAGLSRDGVCRMCLSPHTAGARCVTLRVSKENTPASPVSMANTELMLKQLLKGDQSTTAADNYWTDKNIDEMIRHFMKDTRSGTNN